MTSELKTHDDTNCPVWEKYNKARNEHLAKKRAHAEYMKSLAGEMEVSTNYSAECALDNPGY